MEDETTLNAQWHQLSLDEQRQLLEDYDPDWVEHFAGDEDAAWLAYRADEEFTQLTEEFYATL